MSKKTNKKLLPLSKVYRVLESGPVVLVTTLRNSRPNIMAMSWHMMMEFEPPLIGCIVSNRNFTFNILRSSKACVINIPTVELAAKVVGCGNTSGRTVDKFTRFGLTAVPSVFVMPPRIEECYANFECRVVDTTLVSKYNMFILEVLKAWIDPARKHPRTIHHRGKGTFMAAGRTIVIASKMK